MPRQSSRCEVRPAALASSQPPAVVAQQLGDLLLAFPCAASGGVAWEVLAKKYEERYKARLDVKSLGHETALAAATTLLWDVLRIVDTEDEHNPIVGVDDAVSLTARPGLLGCWPSLYSALCNIVLENGVSEQPAAADTQNEAGTSKSLLLSQIRPLLERYWHANFEESGLGYLNEDGSFVRLKKLKHLLHAVLRWRDQRQLWRRMSSPQQQQTPVQSAVDVALEPTLRLMASDKHNDLVLHCSLGESDDAARAASPVTSSSVFCGSEAKQHSSKVHQPAIFQDVASAPEDQKLHLMQQELDRLRVENSSLREFNWALQCSNRPMLPLTSTSTCGASGSTAAAPTYSCSSSNNNTNSNNNSNSCNQVCQELPEPDLPSGLFDDPFEPPPEAYWSNRKQSMDTSNSDTMSICSLNSSSMISGTPRWQCHSGLDSGCLTPQQPLQQQHAACAFVPTYWFSMVPAAFSGVDVSVIPRGIVQTARDHFENLCSK